MKAHRRGQNTTSALARLGYSEPRDYNGGVELEDTPVVMR
jgi:hypothetical protein